MGLLHLVASTAVQVPRSAHFTASRQTLTVVQACAQAEAELLLKDRT